MLTYSIMLLILLFMALIVAVRDGRGKQADFFDLESSNCMRGFWCLVILLVHVPTAYQNTLQDLTGSFAYIGVTFFFMTSGYGLMLGIKNKGIKSIEGFWLRRLPKLLLPMFLTNIVLSLANLCQTGVYNPADLINFHGFVRQLLVFYFIFWAVFRFIPQKVSENQKTLIICGAVLLISLSIYIFKISAWATESFGFIYGILLAHYKSEFEAFAKQKWLAKSIGFCAAALIFGIAYLKFKHVVFIGEYLIKVILGLAILIFILTLNSKISIGNPVGRFMGKISYEVYLLHGAVFTLISSIAPDINSGLFILLSILVTVALSPVINRISNMILSLISKPATKNAGDGVK